MHTNKTNVQNNRNTKKTPKLFSLYNVAHFTLSCFLSSSPQYECNGAPWRESGDAECVKHCNAIAGRFNFSGTRTLYMFVFIYPNSQNTPFLLLLFFSDRNSHFLENCSHLDFENLVTFLLISTIKKKVESTNGSFWFNKITFSSHVALSIVKVMSQPLQGSTDWAWKTQRERSGSGFGAWTSRSCDFQF